MPIGEDSPLFDATTHPERNYHEEFSHENGEYLNTCIDCVKPFLGHKRRFQCKVCMIGELDSMYRGLKKKLAENEVIRKTQAARINGYIIKLTAANRKILEQSQIFSSPTECPDCGTDIEPPLFRCDSCAKQAGKDRITYPKGETDD